MVLNGSTPLRDSQPEEQATRKPAFSTIYPPGKLLDIQQRSHTPERTPFRDVQREPVRDSSYSPYTHRTHKTDEKQVKAEDEFIQKILDV